MSRGAVYSIALLWLIVVHLQIWQMWYATQQRTGAEPGPCWSWSSPPAPSSVGLSAAFPALQCWPSQACQPLTGLRFCRPLQSKVEHVSSEYFSQEITIKVSEILDEQSTDRHCFNATRCVPRATTDSSESDTVNRHGSCSHFNSTNTDCMQSPGLNRISLLKS